MSCCLLAAFFFACDAGRDRRRGQGDHGAGREAKGAGRVARYDHLEHYERRRCRWDEKRLINATISMCFFGWQVRPGVCVMLRP